MTSQKNQFFATGKFQPSDFTKSQNTTPISKRSSSHRKGDEAKNQKHLCGSLGSKFDQVANNAANNKKRSPYSNFLSNTQKLDSDNFIQP